MSDAPVQSTTAIAVLAIPRSLASRATRWIDRAGRQGIARVERAALRCKAGVRASGPVGWLGLGLLFGALIAAWSMVLPQRDGLAGLRASVAASQRASGAGAAGPRPGTAGFLARLPARRELPAILGVVLEQAQATQISLESGQYDWRPGKDGGVGEYRVALPVHGTYPAIRQFIEKTLAAAPPVALESLHLSRDEVAENAIDAEITFVIYVGASA